VRRHVWWAGLALTFLVAAAAGPTPALTLSVSPSAAQYEESLDIFPNPERGWFWPIDPKCCGTDLPHPPVEVGRLRALRGRPEAITLVRDGVLLGRHMHEPISPQTLNRIQADWDAARRAGVKVIVRFLYDWSLNNRDPEEAILAGHLDQLAPLLTANEDIIATVEAGLFGGSGEGNRSDRGYVYFDPRRGGWHRLSEAGIRIYGKLLSRVPRSRQMLVRYPRFKMSRIPLRLDLRQVAPNSEGVLSAVEQVQLPTGSGSYDVGLHFPDASPGIAHRVEYALRLASEGLWDPATGIHWLGIEIGSR
jgi:Domain of unknown function (DUF4874)